MMIFDYFAVLFESTVKTKGYQTAKILHCAGHKFESTVKTKGYQTRQNSLP